MIARVDDQVDDRVRLQVASMGGRAVLEAYGVGRAVLHDAADLLEELELLWSRFEPSSELNALCRAAGTPVRVSKRTFGLVEALVDAWFRTGGRFDPTIRRALEAHGYDRDFLDIRPVIGGAHMSATGPSPGCENIVLDAAELIVELPVGMLLDAGGLAKGLAADIVASFVMERGATGVVANLAGDIRTMGVGPLDGLWPVSIEDPFANDAVLCTIAVGEGAVCTSSVVRRSWGAHCHHIIDPTSGRPTDRHLVAATACADSAAWADAATKALLLADIDDDIFGVLDVEGLLVADDGTVSRSTAFATIECTVANRRCTS